MARAMTTNLAIKQPRTAQANRDEALLDQAIDSFRHLSAVSLQSDRHRSGRYINLVIALQNRFAISRKIEDLNEIIETLGRLSSMIRISDKDRSRHCIKLAGPYE
jgi:hypothetical protein